MNLININLLPYREIAEAKKKKAFQFIMVGGALAGLAAAAFGWFVLSNMLDSQNARNQALEDGLAALEKDLATIKDLQKRKEAFLLRKSKVEELDNKRFEGARIMDSLNQLTPDGVYLTALKGENRSGAVSNKYVITGRALTDNKVAIFMKSLPSTGVFDEATLVKITQNEEIKAQEFELSTKLLEPKPNTAQAKPVNNQASAPAVNAASAPK